MGSRLALATLGLTAVLILNGGGIVRAAEWQDGAGPEWRTLLAEAQKEGHVVVAGRPQVGEPMKQAFKRDTGITIDFLGGNGRDLDSRVLREVRSKQVTIDIMLSGATLVGLVHQGFFQAIKPQLVLPGVTGSENWTDGHIRWVDKAGQYLFIGGEYVFGQPIFNTDIIKPGTIKTWKDLLKPEYRGKIASYDPTSGPGDAQGGYVVDLYGIDFFRDLYVGQKVAISRDSRQLMEWGARGVYPIILGGLPVELEQFQRAGIRTQEVEDLEDGHGTLVGGSSVVVEPTGAPHPAAAAVFLNWFASQPGQTVFSTVWRTPSTRRDVEVPTIPEFVKPKPSLQYIAQYREDWYDRYMSEYRQKIVAAMGGP